jgi:adenine phosphoribosyltransferase
VSGEIASLKSAIRNVPDFPVPGILFKDITPILGRPDLLATAVDALSAFAREQGAQVVAGIEARGFMLAAPVALALGVPFVPIRKAGKLPWKTVKASYSLEYGTAEIEVHEDAFAPGQRVVVIDDLLATGGTAKAACELVESLGGVVAGLGFVVELTFLSARDKLPGREIASFVRYAAGE